MVICFSSDSAFGQVPACQCRDFLDDELKPPDSLFHVTSDLTIGLCGYIDRGNEGTFFSEFTLYDCSAPDTSFHEWSAVETCTISVTDSSLVVMELMTVPQGPLLDLMSVPCWKWEFSRSADPSGNMTIDTRSTLIVELPVPTTVQLEQWEKRLHSASFLNEELVAYLFLCAAHDLDGWRDRFTGLRGTERIDGGVAEYHSELIGLLDWIPRKER